MPIKIIVNPASGNGRTGKTWNTYEVFLRTFFDEVEVSFTRAEQDAVIITHQALEQGFDHVIAVGGDGTMSEVVNGFFVNGKPVNPNAIVSFIPSGTGSDIARTLNLPIDKNQAIKRIAERKAKNIIQFLDIGKIEYKRFDGSDFTGYFCNALSFGMGGEVVKRVNKASFLKRFGGKITFNVASLLTLLSYTNKEVRLQVFHENAADKRCIADETMNVRIVAIANGRFFGGSMMIAPEAAPDDGLFDIVTVENLSAFGAARKLPLIYTGAHIGDPSVRAFRGNLIIAEGLNGMNINSAPILIDSDGEGVGMLPLRIELLPRVLPLV